jgi:hypothetical protein
MNLIIVIKAVAMVTALYLINVEERDKVHCWSARVGVSLVRTFLVSI